MTDPGEKHSYEVGYAKPPHETRFRPGRSGNPKGRPKYAKNFRTAIEQELRTTISVTENGRRRRIPKRQVIAKQLVNRAAEGDLKAMPLLLNEVRDHEQVGPGAIEEILGGPDQQPVINSVIARIRAASDSKPGENIPVQDDSRQLKLPLAAPADPRERSS